MNVGELFINLGIKGSEKTVGAIAGVHKGMSELASTSIETKAAILGAMYGLERLMSISGQAGTGLTNFSALTGMSAKQLQQWQYAARQAGVAGEEITGSLKSVQSAMTNMLLGKGMPSGLGILQSSGVGFDVKRARDTMYVMEQLQKSAQALPADVFRNVGASFGLSEGVMAGMRRNMFRPDVFAKAPIYSDKEISALNRANVGWSNLGLKIEMAVGHFNAKHGGQMVKDLMKMTESSIHLAEALQNISEKFNVFETASHGVEGLANSLKLVSELVDRFGGKEPKKGDLTYQTPGSEIFPGLSESPAGKLFRSLFGDPGVPSPAIKPEMYFPLPAYPNTRSSTHHNSVNVHQTFQHDGKDHKRTAESTHKAVQQALRQITAIGQGS